MKKRRGFIQLCHNRLKKGARLRPGPQRMVWFYFFRLAFARSSGIAAPERASSASRDSTGALSPVWAGPEGSVVESGFVVGDVEGFVGVGMSGRGGRLPAAPQTVQTPFT